MSPRVALPRRWRIEELAATNPHEASIATDARPNATPRHDAPFCRARRRAGTIVHSCSPPSRMTTQTQRAPRPRRCGAPRSRSVARRRRLCRTRPRGITPCPASECGCSRRRVQCAISPGSRTQSEEEGQEVDACDRRAAPPASGARDELSFPMADRCLQEEGKRDLRRTRGRGGGEDPNVAWLTQGSNAAMRVEAKAREKLADSCRLPLRPAFTFAGGTDAGRAAAIRPACIPR
jgi:hypothetical protein